MSEDRAVLLFDGVCNTCNAIVNWLLRVDGSARIHFASLQSPAALNLSLRYELPQDLDTVVFIKEGRAHVRSEAVIEVLRTLGGGWKILAGICSLFPRRLLDVGYRAFARNRYRLFGKKETCRMPTPEERERFL